MPDEVLRTRDDHEGVQHPEPEQHVYTAYITVPLKPATFTTTRALYDVAEDGTVTLVDTRPAPLQVNTADDGSITVRVPE